MHLQTVLLMVLQTVLLMFLLTVLLSKLMATEDRGHRDETDDIDKFALSPSTPHVWHHTCEQTE